MAHIIKVPIEVEFAPTPRKWEVCEVELADLPSKKAESLIPVPIFDSVLTPQPGLRLRGKPTASFTERLNTPYYIAFNFAEKGLPELLKERDSLGVRDALEILVSFPRKLKPTLWHDPWQMRDEFLHLRRTTLELCKFLNKWGSWGTGALQEHSSTFATLGEEFTEYVVPQEVWSLQADYKAALASDAPKWLSESGRMPTLTRRSSPPFLASRDVQCVHAIQTTITIDKLMDAPYRLCERADCGNVFKVESNHSRSYCSQPCAHLVSVRRGRDAKRQAKADAAKENK